MRNNSIKDIRVLSNLTQLEELDVSLNPIELYEPIKDYSKMKKALLDQNIVSLFDPNKNKLRIEQEKNLLFYTFLQSFYVTTSEQEFNYDDCKLIFKYLKYNIILNLFYHEHVQLFLTQCLSYEIDMV